MRSRSPHVAAAIAGLVLGASRTARADDEPTPPAAAEERIDNRGHLGIGYQLSLGGARGIAIRYGAGPVTLSGIVGLRLISPDDQSQDTRLGAELALGLGFPLKRWNGTHFGLGLRAAMGFKHIQNEDVPEGADPFGLAFEVPLYVEAWLSRRIALLVEGGLVLHVVGDEGSPLLDRPSGLALGIGAGGLFGSAGLTFYF